MAFAKRLQGTGTLVAGAQGGVTLDPLGFHTTMNDMEMADREFDFTVWGSGVLGAGGFSPKTFKRSVT